MSSAEAAADICEKLQAAGVRATTDPQALSPPCVLVPPPARTYDLNCGYTATWRVIALAPAPTGGDRTTWALLDQLVDTIAGAFAVATADPGAYVLGPTSFPSYTVTFTEALDS